MQTRPALSSPSGVYLVLALGVGAISVAAPLIRVADAPALTIAAYRMLLAALPALTLAICRRRAELRGLSSAELRAMLLSGVCLAGHFATWVASVQDVSVASSVALVTTSPLFLAAIALLFLRRRTSRGMTIAIAVAAAGGLLIGAADFAKGENGPVGDLLALAGAAFAAGFLLLGGGVRRRVSLLAYVGVVYPAAALLLMAMALAARQPLSGFRPHTYLALALLALVPQLFGHSALSWTLRYLSAQSVAIAILGEPVIATLLAALFLGEPPGIGRVVGGALILAGVYLALRQEGSVRELAAAAPMSNI